MTHKNHH